MAVIERWRPEMAMVADYEYPSQKGTMLAQVADVAALGVRPMVCPKFPGAVADIPAGVVLAISVPTEHAGFLPVPGEVAGWDLHFLGGHPDQYVILQRIYEQGNLISLDCSSVFQKAMFGAFWSARGNTWRYVKHRFSTAALVRMSVRTIPKYMSNPPRWFIKDRARLRAVGFQLRPALF